MRRYRFLLLAMVCCGCSQEKTPPAPPATGAPAATGTPAAAPLTPVKLALNWYPEAEHGGFYAAQVLGLYRDVGLDVEILKGGPNAPVVPLVAGGKAMFGISNADGLLLGRAEEAPVVAVMAPLQISPRCIMVHKSSGITGFDQLRDMTIAMSSSQPFCLYLQKKGYLQGVTIVPYQGSVAQFLTDPKFAQQGYLFSEPYVAEQQGGDPHALMLADAGFNPYTSVLFTSDAVVEDHPDLVRRMVSASVLGWQRYLENPEETNRHIHEINPEMDLKSLEYGVGTLRPLVLDDVARQEGLGHMSLARWRELLSQMQEIELVKPGALSAEQAFTAEFLPAPAAQPETASAP